MIFRCENFTNFPNLICWLGFPPAIYLNNFFLFLNMNAHELPGFISKIGTKDEHEIEEKKLGRIDAKCATTKS